MFANVRIDTGFLAPAEGAATLIGWRAARRHSRRVRLLRVLLPAIASLAAIWMVISAQSLPNGVGNVDLGEVGLDGTKLTMRNPSLTGFNDNGTAYQVTAERALQDIANPRVVTLEDIEGTMTKPDGTEVRLTAANGVFDSDAEQLTLTEEIVVHTNEGERAFLQAADVDLKAGSIVSDKPVRAETKSGSIRAETMEITDRGAHLLFRGGVVVELRLDGGELGEEPDDAQ